MKFEKEIEGLRGWAIILVVLYHLGLNEFGAGFIGVDVFFVISGYIITKVVYLEIFKNSFDLKMFFVKRARRLLPALFVTLFITYFASLLILSPIFHERLSGALIAATFAVSNFYYIGEINYFDPVSSLKPFLHTWSLAVEEQFYLIWPAIMLLILSKCKHPLQKIYFIRGCPR